MRQIVSSSLGWVKQKTYKIGICCFSAKHTSLRSKSKDWLARNQDNASEWTDMSPRGVFFQWTNTVKIRVALVQSGYHHHLIEMYLLFSPYNSRKIAHLAGVEQQSPTHSHSIHVIDGKWLVIKSIRSKPNSIYKVNFLIINNRLKLKIDNSL
jgi:hypothetical protein